MSEGHATGIATDHRMSLVFDFMPAVKAVENPVHRDACLQVLHRLTGIEERVLMELAARTTPHRDDGAVEVLGILGGWGRP
jgi:hypothetical protein